MSFQFVAYLVPLVVLWFAFARHQRRTERANVSALEASVASGLSEPPTLHPLIDPARCLGCGACARACPEGGVIGLIQGKARLIEGANCIGHGACKEACPFDAITLVFGTEKRGVDIPEVGADFQTDVPGLFIAGELGGMGLIRNAVEQGRQAVVTIDSVARSRRHRDCDLIIVGAGPAGLAAGLAAKSRGLRFEMIEQETFGGTVSHFPRGKIVMTQPMDLPLVGKMRFHEVKKEKLLDFWAEVLKREPLPLVYGERVEKIVPRGQSFEVLTNRGTRSAATVLLAIGRRGTPRKLGVQGEALAKVVYRLIDPKQYHGKKVLVVGGGDSALEAAAELAECAACAVTLSYRSSSFSRAKQKNRNRIDRLAAAGLIDVLLGSNVLQVHEDCVVIDHRGQAFSIENDIVIICAGGILPSKFLSDIGVGMETKYGTA